MKIITLFLLITTAFIFTSCKKQSIPISDSIVGRWELSQDGGGWGPIIYHKPGNDTLAIFTATTYSFYNREKLVKSGTYVVKKDTSYLYNQLMNRIIFDNNTDLTREFTDIQNNQLSFWLDAYDAGSTTYRRIR